jgi:hypothetical protein
MVPKTFKQASQAGNKYVFTEDGGSMFVTFFCPKCCCTHLSPLPARGREEYLMCKNCGAVLCLRGMAELRCRVSAWLKGEPG